jgi:hypothetical protein
MDHRIFDFGFSIFDFRITSLAPQVGAAVPGATFKTRPVANAIFAPGHRARLLDSFPPVFMDC